MEKFCIVTNKIKDGNLQLTTHIKEYLEAKGKTCIIAQEKNEDDPVFVARKNLSVIPEDTDLVIVLGGDGTVLQAARSMAYMDMPLIGVNLGTMGYLTEVAVSDVDNALDRILAGDYEIEERMMLRGSLDGKKDYSLNDVIISKYQGIAAIGYNLYINDKFLCSYYADGLVISTPTGSTGYNMSAGGPIIEPLANMLLVTPICPHSLNSRSLLFSPDNRIEVELLKGRNGFDQQAIVSFDGSGTLIMNTGDKIEVKKSKKTTKILRLNQVSFLEKISKKFEK
ncbi:NAD(+)/NADH kinase [Butyrivibrio sp. CB08]|uniref:NAD(+)/NADH kinase n=1 Tax=Butyrivibrio sp. CB08 TaxID=2364879 RepID=UPI000EA98573|nr:NAD(+)/NADH kinase [Butyrivibrio sp. CB08]RKM62129.1 NAD(+)/NADH kinase [Butyrivibrio sp. CB08]